MGTFRRRRNVVSEHTRTNSVDPPNATSPFHNALALARQTGVTAHHDIVAPVHDAFLEVDHAVRIAALLDDIHELVATPLCDAEVTLQATNQRQSQGLWSTMSIRTYQG